MSLGKKRGDLLVFPTLCALAVLLIAVGLLAGEFALLRSLRQNAVADVKTSLLFVTDRLDSNLGFRPEEHSTSPAPSIDLMHQRHIRGDVRSAVILDTSGRLAVPEMPGGRNPYDFPSVRERAIFAKVLATGSPLYLLPSETEPHRTIFYEPVTIEGELAGVLRLDLDQAGEAEYIRDAMRSRRALSISLGLVGLMVALLIIWRHIKGRWRIEEEIRFLGMHDSLTRLPNRSQFNLRLRQAVERSRQNSSMLAVLCIDVDNFKDINDTLGHPVGDRVLKATAERLLAASGPSATVAHLSGDEFAVFIEDVRNETLLRKNAERYLRIASIANDIDGHELVSSISIGIATAPGDGNDAETLMKNADLALYQAKADGRNTLRFFTRDMDADLQRRRRLEAELRRDLSTDRIKVHYQPQFDLWTGKVIGHEALARWSHPELGEISPAEFIPIAESSGLMSGLSERVLVSACQAACRWPGDSRLAVNLSAAQFRTGEVAGTIEKILGMTKLEPSRLEVEITESVLLQNTASAHANLNRMRKLGISIALDDFGTGYSSLSYLSRFPIDKIKIDRSFVQRLCEDSNTAAIVSAIIGLGKALRIDITAEGVETHEQLALLRAMGCHQVQGFLFGEPRETADFPVPQVILMQEALNRAAG